MKLYLSFVHESMSCTTTRYQEVTIMWHLVWGNILGFLEMFKDSHVWLQITLGNQMPREFGFLL